MRLLAFTIIAIPVLIGCHHHKTDQPVPPPPMPHMVTERSESSLPQPAVRESPVEQGTAPLAYIVEGSSVVKIVEMDSGRTLAQVNAPAGSVLTIEEASGVRIGNDLLVKGPLPAGRTYQIFLENGGGNVFRSELSKPIGRR
jgi:hypothetical protein